MNTYPSGLIVAGMQSGAGKTAVTCMLLAALSERGLAIQPFKMGPDFIDPGYHTMSFVLVLVLDLWRRGAFALVKPSAEATPLQDLFPALSFAASATFKDRGRARARARGRFRRTP